MTKRAVLLKSLKRGRILPSYNKWNLFNLYKKEPVNFKAKSLYQQKWLAKQEARHYHGEFITEKRFQTMFSGKLNSVAQLDASLKGDTLKETPFMLQTFAPLEKRLDFALFRAMFSSSVRQARQFILHGYVQVNGRRICYPGYCLQPGDLFHVNPDKVLQAMGEKKPSLTEALKIDKRQIVLWNHYVSKAKKDPKKVWLEKIKKLKEDNNSAKLEQLKEEIKNNNDIGRKTALRNCNINSWLKELLTLQKNNSGLTKESFNNLVKQSPNFINEIWGCYNELLLTKLIDKDLLKDMNNEKILQYANQLISPDSTTKNNWSDSTKNKLRSTIKKLNAIIKKTSEAISLHYSSLDKQLVNDIIPYDPHWADSLQYHDKLDTEALMKDEQLGSKLIKLPWQNHIYGRQDPKKSYFTPWKPRQFFQPFAILPHHLEISFKLCSAIYLRDPVARPGHSEVISPLDISVHKRAYMYYVRKGK